MILEQQDDSVPAVWKVAWEGGGWGIGVSVVVGDGSSLFALGLSNCGQMFKNSGVSHIFKVHLFQSAVGAPERTRQVSGMMLVKVGTDLPARPRSCWPVGGLGCGKTLWRRCCWGGDFFRETSADLRQISKFTDPRRASA